MKNKLSIVVVLSLIIFLSLTLVSSEAQAEKFNIALSGKAQTLDPAFLQRSISEWPIMNSIFSGLVKYKPGTYEVVPDLAKDWEFSEDDTKITFYLKEGVKFHKGYGEVTAGDVEFSFERIIDPDKGSPEAESFSKLEDVKVIDNYTVQLILSEPMARLFTSTLPYNAGLIVSKQAVQEMGREEFSSNPIGSGPYQFEEWKIDSSIVLKRFEDYFGQPAYIEEVEFIPMAEQMSQELALRSGEIDFGEVSLENYQQIQENEDLATETYPDLAFQWVAFNVQKAPMDNPHLREALRYIIDPAEILIGAFADQADLAYSWLLPDMLGYKKLSHKRLDEVGRDKILDLLEKAGYPNGEGLTLKYVTDANDIRKNIATLVQAQLAEFNIQLQIEAMEIGPKIEAWHNGEYHITYARFGNTVDPGYCSQWFLSRQVGNWNLMHWSNEEYDQLWEQAEKTMNEDERAKLYQKMQTIVDEADIAVWVTHGVKTPTWNDDYEVTLTPSGGILSWLVQKKSN
ncbi:MAG TPA: ABC transporter substrate-binding protein [Halanaerobiales bacterium]|nr:ABC transporter substrate-binding protein [Halanaerobiales bacterium]